MGSVSASMTGGFAVSDLVTTFSLVALFSLSLIFMLGTAYVLGAYEARDTAEQHKVLLAGASIPLLVPFFTVIVLRALEYV